MASIQRFYNRTITIRREGAGPGKQTYSTVTVALPVHIQRDQSGPAIDSFGVDGKEDTGWMDIDSDIQKDDMVIADDGRIYIVTKITKQGEDTAMNEHLEISLRNYPK